MLQIQSQRNRKIEKQNGAQDARSALKHRLLTVDEFERMAETGIFAPDERVELIEGELVAMSPIGDKHALCINRLNRYLMFSVRDTAVVSIQNPIVLDEHSEPQPDVALWRARKEGYQRKARAADVLLVVEVADSTFASDRDVKIPMYARAKIPEVWLVDLNGKSVFQLTRPSHEFYGNIHHLKRKDTLTCEILPMLKIPVSEILG